MSESWHQLVGSRKRWEIVRRQALERAGGLCEVRGPTCSITATEADHILAVADGGHPTDLGNVRASCRPCNAWQGGKVGNRRERANRRLGPGDLAPFSGDGPKFSALTPEERYNLGYCSRIW